jgi:hypothetical protein
MATKHGPRLLRAFGALLLVAMCAGMCAYVWLRPSEALCVLVGGLLLTPLAALGLYPDWWRRREPLEDAARDLERRRPVWSALSALYLDTELDGADHARIAGVLDRSGYSPDQLEEILYRELHPILIGNLLSGVGEWAYFDVAWLERRILARGPRPSRFALVLGVSLVRSEWQTIRTRLAHA